MKVLLDLLIRGLGVLSVIGMLLFGTISLFTYNSFSGKYEYFTQAILPTILCACVLFGCIRYELARRKSILARAKEQSGIDFSHGRRMGKWEDVLIVFDESSRKILVSVFGGVSVFGNYGISIHPYEYIKSWRLTWVETSNNGRLSEKDAKIELELNDIDRPLLVVPMSSKRDGQAWTSRLDILLRSR